MHWIDPDCLPELKGVVERFLLNPHGEADGMILSDGAEVHFPPHMAREVVAEIERRPHSEVRIRGVRPRGAPVFAAVSIQTEGGDRIEDHGPSQEREKEPPKPRIKAKDAVVAGHVSQTLHGPKGERRGVLLESGTIVRFPPHAAEALHRLLNPGAFIAAGGPKIETRLGTVVDAHELGANENDLRPIEKKHPAHKPKKPHEHR
jgi:hypothetical protein